MLRIIKTKEEHISRLLELRREMLTEMGRLSYTAEDSFMKETEDYLRNGDQTTVMAMADDIIGCATICYINLLPTPDHPAGKRAHLMNVYTRPEFRRQGIGKAMIGLLIEEAKNSGVTEITLDADSDVQKFYRGAGFEANGEGMVLNFQRQLRKNIELMEKYGIKPHCCGE